LIVFIDNFSPKQKSQARTAGNLEKLAIC